MQEKRIIRSAADSLSRLDDAKAEVRSQLDPSIALEQFERLTKPKSPAGAMRKIGWACIAAPDPITAIPGVALLASSYVMKKREPMSLSNLATETRKIIRDIESLTL